VARLSKPITNAVPNQLGISLSDAVSMWERSLRAENRAPKTLHAYLYAMARVTDILGGEVLIENVRRRSRNPRPPPVLERSSGDQQRRRESQHD
jgi:hypothetical protein